jgi:predicted Zn-ribbon and HTH transcriptional regulator
MRKIPNSSRRLDEHISRALNKIRKPSTAEEITELLNRDLEPEDRTFREKEVAERLRNTEDTALILYWSRTRPRR